MLSSARRIAISATLSFAVLAGGAGVAQARGPVDQQNLEPVAPPPVLVPCPGVPPEFPNPPLCSDPSQPPFTRIAVSDTQLTQTFTAGRDGLLDGVDVTYEKNRLDDPSTFTAAIYAVDASDRPTGAALAQDSVPAPAQSGTLSFDFDQPSTQTSGTRYALRVTAEGETFALFITSNDNYKRGALGGRTGADLAFSTYASAPVTPPPPVVTTLLTGNGTSGVGTTFDFQVTRTAGQVGGHARLDMNPDRRYGLREGTVTCFSQNGPAAVFGIRDTAGSTPVYREFYVKDGAETRTPDRLSELGKGNTTAPPATCRNKVPARTTGRPIRSGDIALAATPA